MYLVLGSRADASARWAWRGLADRGLEPLEWIDAESLAGARWEHRVGTDGTDVEITLADGRAVRAAGVRGVLNRLAAVPGPDVAHPEDREYARQELAAFHLSWLHALPAPMLGRPAPYGLCGAWRHASEWASLAAWAGLATPAHHVGSDGPSPAPAGAGPARTVYVVAGEVAGRNVPAEVAEGCRRLAEMADATLLGIGFTVDDGGAWTFAGATPLPDLVPGGDALLDAIARALRGDGSRDRAPASRSPHHPFTPSPVHPVTPSPRHLILLCGIPSEGPMARVRREMDALGAPCVFFNQRRFDDVALRVEIRGGKTGGELRIDREAWPLEAFGGIYARLMDDRLLPELEGEPGDSPRRARCRALHEALLRWTEIAPARVVNRAAAMASNSSKPYQSQLIRRHGFHVPETLVTTDPDAVRRFRRRHGRIVYKSLSGVRSVVQTLEEDDLERLERIRWCPTQFQAFVDGTNVRVHVVGARVFATAIHTGATDYRYAERQGSDAELEPVELDPRLADRCATLARSLGLAFAGVDLKLTPDGRVFCFEVNPSPAFSYYESHTAQPIARAVAAYLAGMN
ncbi:MAG TPA: hypothetical protein VHG08_18010 [Longimicrobium sp.]|nr:hypothetical protein [Longimicrobium sp.]